MPWWLPYRGATYPAVISEPLLPCVTDTPQAGGPCLLQEVPDVVCAWAQIFLLREESGEDEDGARQHLLHCWPPPNVHRRWMKPSSYLSFASLRYLLEPEMGQLSKPGALLCSGPARGCCLALQSSTELVLSSGGTGARG